MCKILTQKTTKLRIFAMHITLENIPSVLALTVEWNVC